MEIKGLEKKSKPFPVKFEEPVITLPFSVLIKRLGSKNVNFGVKIFLAVCLYYYFFGNYIFYKLNYAIFYIFIIIRF